ncbi:MAG: hypothetical protein R3A80_13780 [Bdellovibrionota bacterium]
MRSLGIHVDSRTIRILDIGITSKKLALNGVFEMDRGSGETLSEILKSYFSSTPRPDRVVASIGNVPVVVKNFHFPFKDRTQVRQAILGEFEDTLPIEIENFVLETQLLGRENSLNTFTGALISREPLEDMNRVFEAIDVMPSDFLLPSEAYGRLGLSFLSSEFDPGSVVCFCDIGFDFTQVSTVEFPVGSSGKLKPNSYVHSLLDYRHITRGAKDIYDQEGNRLALSAKEFEEYMATRVSFAASSTDSLKNAVRPLLVELYQVTQAAMSKSGRKVAHFVLTGSLAHCPGFRDFFETELRTPTLVWDPFQNIDVSKAPLDINTASRFVVPLALALRHGALSSLPWLNFRRSSKRKQVISAALEQLSQPEFRSRMLPLAFLCIGIFALSLTAIFMMETRLEKQTKRTQSALSRAKAPLNSTLETFESFKAKQFAKIPGKGTNTPILEELNRISAAIPSSLKVEELNITSNSKGKSLQASLNVSKNPSFEAADLEKSLKAQGFSEVSIDGQGSMRQVKMKGE